MQTEIILSGFGGQGALFAGQLLAYAALENGLNVTWFPSYGPEMRGGTANVTVCVSDSPIGSPYITKPSALLVMNQPSLEKYGPAVQPNGVIIINRTLVPVTIEREDCRVIYVDATDLAVGIGSQRSANIVMFGVYVGWSEIVTREVCLSIVEREFSRKPKFLPMNVAAFKAGHDAGQKARKSD